jgi:hypothetical protein
MVTASITDLGPDTVDLVVRAPITGPGGAPVLDQWGRPQRAESTITRTRCSVQINDGTEEVLGSVISVLKLRAMLPVDEATEALTAGDAAVFKGRRYELTMPGVRHEFLEGDPSHVRIAGTWASDVSLGEQVLADFTVVLDLDAPISDGDWIVVRGRECRATVQRREDPEPARRVLVVYAAYRAGGNG